MALGCGFWLLAFMILTCAAGAPVLKVFREMVFFQIEISRISFNLNNMMYNWSQSAIIYLASSAYHHCAKSREYKIHKTQFLPISPVSSLPEQWELCNLEKEEPWWKETNKKPLALLGRDTWGLRGCDLSEWRGHFDLGRHHDLAESSSFPSEKDVYFSGEKEKSERPF